MKLPPVQKKSSSWYSAKMMAKQEVWQWYLSNDEKSEIDNAAEYILLNDIPLHLITKKSFSLPKFSKRLAKLRKILIQGIGFTVIKGLQVDSYTEKELYAIFMGIGAHLGNPRSQNAEGHLLGHVYNMGYSSDDPRVRIYQTQERQSFHTDSCDVVALLCVQPAKTGGLSLLVSAETVFNEIKKRNPELTTLLFQPIATDRRGEVPEGMLPYLLIPVYSYFKKELTVFYQRQYIESAQRFEDAPRLTKAHFEALDLFDSLCNDPSLHLSMMLEKGDMQFVYNHNMLHDRTGFEDWPEIDKRRHLLRLWLSVEGDRPLPDIFASRFATTEIGNRGGIEVPGCKKQIPFFKDIYSQ